MPYRRLLTMRRGASGSGDGRGPRRVPEAEVSHLAIVWLGAGLALAFMGCGVNRSAEWHDEGGYRLRELAVPRRGGAGFTQLAASKTGLDFSNVVTEEQMLQNRHLVQGSGVTLGDMDGDGLVDIYLARIEGHVQPDS